MNKKAIRIFILFSIIGILHTACQPTLSNPEIDLIGKWEYVSNQNGNSNYFHNLVFHQDGSMIIEGISLDLEYVIIAPGRMKITLDEETKVLNFEVVEDQLNIFFDDGTNHYQRVTPPTAIVEAITETPIIENPTTTVTETTIMMTATSPTSTSTIQPTVTETSTTAPLSTGSSLIREKDGMQMLYIPEGEFLMGSSNRDDDAYAHEKPQHRVYLGAFWMDAYEVSNAMFRTFVTVTGYRTQAEKHGFSYMYNAAGAWDIFNGVNWQHPLGSDTQYQDLLPVTHVNLYDAQAYCEWAGGRLPTEAEWEKAARGDDERLFPWGNTFDSTFLQSNGKSGPVSIYSYPKGASPYGILNMAGNVFEWTSDWFYANYYAQSPVENPQGLESGEYKTIRGGAWINSQKHVRTTHRDFSMPHLMNHLLGFRCVMDP